jgi:nucleotide-binding universal stress UspA family protein
MAKYKKILVAYDGSESAKNALAVSVKLAKQDNSWIKVLDVVSPYTGGPELNGDSNIKEIIVEPAEELLAGAREIADKEGIQILTALAQGEPFERITAIAEEDNCDLIVMGRQGISHFERELMGSVTARVIGHTTRNVLVVPENFTWDGKWGAVLLAMDGSPNCSTANDVALEIAKQRSVRIAALTVTKTDISNESAAFSQAATRKIEMKAENIVNELKERAAVMGIDVVPLVKHGQPHQEIIALTAELGVTVIVMCTHGKTGIKRLLMGSVTQRTIGHADCPVLVVPNRDRCEMK